jgi:hypothetical protein
MTRKEELQRIIVDADRELHEIREAEAKAREPEYLGKCYKSHQPGQQSYSESHYWYRYMMVLARKGSVYTGFTFEKSDEHRIRISWSDDIAPDDIGTTAITPQEFWGEWGDLLHYLKASYNHIEECIRREARHQEPERGSRLFT